MPLQVLTNFSEIVVREIERDDLAKHKAQEATKSREAAEGDGMDRLRRALDALSEALVLVDASQPGWPVVYSNIEWHTLVGLKGHENASLWDFILPVPTAGQPKAKCEGDFAEAVQARQVFSLSGRVRKRGSVPGDELHVSCRFKPAEESMDINAVARPPPLPGTGGSTLNKNPLTGYAGESNEIDDLVPVGDADWSSHVLYFVTVVPEKPISSTTYAMGSAAGAMASGAAVGSATKSTQIKAPVAPFVDVRLGRLIGQGGYGQARGTGHRAHPNHVVVLYCIVFGCARKHRVLAPPRVSHPDSTTAAHPHAPWHPRRRSTAACGTGPPWPSRSCGTLPPRTLLRRRSARSSRPCCQ